MSIRKETKAENLARLKEELKASFEKAEKQKQDRSTRANRNARDLLLISHTVHSYPGNDTSFTTNSEHIGAQKDTLASRSISLKVQNVPLNKTSFVTRTGTSEIHAHTNFEIPHISTTQVHTYTSKTMADQRVTELEHELENLKINRQLEVINAQKDLLDKQHALTQATETNTALEIELTKQRVILATTQNGNTTRPGKSEVCTNYNLGTGQPFFDGKQSDTNTVRFWIVTTEINLRVRKIPKRIKP